MTSLVSVQTSTYFINIFTFKYGYVIEIEKKIKLHNNRNVIKRAE